MRLIIAIIIIDVIIIIAVKKSGLMSRNEKRVKDNRSQQSTSYFEWWLIFSIQNVFVIIIAVAAYKDFYSTITGNSAKDIGKVFSF